MQSKERDFFALVAEQNKKNEKARVIKAYRTIKEYYPWNVLAIPSIFPKAHWILSTRSPSWLDW